VISLLLRSFSSDKWDGLHQLKLIHMHSGCILVHLEIMAPGNVKLRHLGSLSGIFKLDHYEVGLLQDLAQWLQVGIKSAAIGLGLLLWQTQCLESAACWGCSPVALLIQLARKAWVLAQSLVLWSFCTTVCFVMWLMSSCLLSTGKPSLTRD
jgi:hypothetical protein